MIRNQYLAQLSFFVVGVFLIFSPATSFAVTPAPAAAPSEFALFEEIPTVTSASRMKESILEAPAAISKITDEDLENWGVVELPNAFRYMPGMDVLAIDENFFGVSPRGSAEASTRRQLTLIDGMSVYEPLASGVHWQNLPLALEDIEDIEVVRGPNDTLYGFNAMTGVINIKTKDPRDTHGMLLRYRWGSNLRNDVVARYGDGLELDGKPFDYRLTYSRDQSEGYGGDQGRGFPDWHRLNLFNFRSRYELSDQWNLESWAGINEGPEFINAQNSLERNNFFSSTAYDFQQLKLNGEFSDTHNASLRFYRWSLGLDGKFLSTGGLTTEDSKQTQYDLELQDSFSWREGKAQTVWGGSLRYNDVRSILIKRLLPDNNVQPATDVLYSFFFNQKYLLWEDAATEKKLTAVAGVRGEGSQLIPDLELAPRASLMYQPKKNHVFRVTYARAFALPSFANEYLTLLIPIPGATVQIVGNRNIKPEQVNTLEGGYSTQLWDGRLALDADVFISRYTGLVDSKSSGLTTTLFNPGRATEAGAELAAEWKVNEILKTFANYTYDHTRDNGDSALNTLRHFTPRSKINFGLYAAFDKEKTPSLPLLDGVSMTLNFHYQSSSVAGSTGSTERVQAYTRVDTRVAKSFYDGNAEIAFSVENLLGQDHLEVIGGAPNARVPRLYYVTVTLHEWPWNLDKKKTS